MSAKKQAYEEKDFNLRLRQAANEGDLIEVKKLVASGLVTINAFGNASGQTALHRAAINNHYAVAEYLISQGADARITDIKGNTPAQCASKEPLKTFLSVAYPLQQAVIFSQKTFSKESSSELDKLLRKDFVNRVLSKKHEEYKKTYSQIIQKTNESGGVPASLEGNEYDRQEALLQEHAEYTAYLIELRYFLEYAHNEGYRLGNCGERTKAAAAFLVANNITNIPIQDVALNFCEAGGHEFLVVGKPTEIPMENVKSSNAIICDPYQTDGNSTLYAIKQLTDMNTCVYGFAERLPGYKPEVHGTATKPDGTNFLLGRKYFEEAWEEQINEIKKYVPKIALTLNETKKQASFRGV